MSFLLDNYLELFASLGAFLTFATLVAKLTPTPKDDKVVAKLVRVFEFFSVNLKK